MADPARLDDLLIRWEESREEGREVSVEQLCADCPELAGSLRKRVAMLKRMSWLEGPADDGEGDSVMELSDSSIAVEVQVSVPIEQFVAAVSSSGLMSLEEIETYRNSLPNDETDTDASALATLLLQQGKLTEYQIDAIAEGKGNNLVLGDYVILDRIGAGGMGQVFKAEHRRMERIVALKMLPDSSTEFPDAVKRFQREVRAAAKLEHPNIVTAHDAGEAAGSHFLVMQYVEGQDLACVLTQSGRLSLAQAVDFITQAARGLEYAHARGVIHRDIKPGNLILAGDGTVKILDMGLARFDESAAIRKAAADEGLTGTGHIMGTAEFMAPEQAEDTHQADHRSDVYSLGCTLYRLLTGKPVYCGATFVQVMLAHRNSPIPSLREQRDDVPEELDAIFQKMVAKAPEDRYQTVSTLLADLADCGIRYERKGPSASSVPERDSGRLASPSVSTDAPSMAAQDTQPSARSQPKTQTNRPNLVKAIGLAALGFVAIAIVFFLRDGRQTIKVEIDSAVVDDATVAVWLDGKQMEISGLGKTIKLKPGEHGYEIRRGDEVITVHKFTVLKGDNPALRIAVEEEGVAAAQAKPTKPPATVAQEPPEKSIAAKATSPTGGRQSPALAVAPFDAQQAKKHQQAWADHLGVPVEKTNSIGMKLVLIPPGEFDMGSTQEEVERLISAEAKQGRPPWNTEVQRSEAPRHRVRITRAFYLGVCEVTQGQYERVMGTNPSRFRESGQDAPVEMVSWEDAAEFCRRLSGLVEEKAAEYRLPTEGEWEYACRGGTTAAWCFDNYVELRDYAWYGGNSGGETHAVGQKKASPFGLHDAHGNVWEWCQDRYAKDYYADSPPSDPSGGTEGEYWVGRGGSWNFSDTDCRSARRYNIHASFRGDYVGFRVAATPTGDGQVDVNNGVGEVATPIKPVRAGLPPVAKATGHKNDEEVQRPKQAVHQKLYRFVDEASIREDWDLSQDWRIEGEGLRLLKRGGTKGGRIASKDRFSGDFIVDVSLVETTTSYYTNVTIGVCGEQVQMRVEESGVIRFQRTGGTLLVARPGNRKPTQITIKQEHLTRPTPLRIQLDLQMGGGGGFWVKAVEFTGTEAPTR